MGDVGEIDNNYVKESPIEIVEILPMGMVEMKIGRKLARICEPKPQFLQKGVVFLVTPDVGSCDWENLISCDLPERNGLKGFTDDPRLVDIGKQVFTGESLKLKPGTIIPPLKKE
ncbi:MAG: hypothetical protein LBJ13_00725 [Puniceicoccales bacterium]|nr:hypothetical protein [Puniceicoccales bacterium]